MMFFLSLFFPALIHPIFGAAEANGAAESPRSSILDDNQTPSGLGSRGASLGTTGKSFFFFPGLYMNTERHVALARSWDRFLAYMFRRGEYVHV